MPHKYRTTIYFVCLLALCLPIFLTACGSFAAEDSAKEPAAKTRSNTPQVLTPEALETAVIGFDPLVIDVSNTAQGYIMANYTGSAAKANIQITGPDGITYKYFLDPSEVYVTLPLTGGNGTYQIDAYENIVDNQYTTLYKEAVEATMESEFLPFLYPNQYVSFTPESQAVKTAAETVKDASSDLNAVADIYHYIIENITYDDAKAQSVTSGYLPDVDATLAAGSGICFDYASLTAAMLRSQKIPTRLEIGYSGEVYHSWISVYIEDIGWIDKIIEFTGNAWTRMDPTFASGNGSSKEILKYIGDGSNYTLQYTH